MAIFKCKMCGGALEINNNETVAVCEYCGTKQTLPKLDDEKRAQLYDRANHFRRANEFDKAMGIYEMILSEEKTDSEAYWGIVLCRYGIEYVEDPRTHKRIPTVNRAQFTSIFYDEDYKSAIKYADGYQKDIYEAEANTIDKIQKGILEISQKEEPFDVFICYKETDNNGNRTQDSVYAQDIYTALTKEGYKVFFSRITLEDKLGSAYEPYIFAAINSAKVMLVVGTEKDNINAVWVKNEWSRYLSLIKAGKEKTLIPVYKDISPYDMPEEFQYLQSQDIGKIGYMQDLIRGIKKITAVSAPKTVVTEHTEQKETLNNAMLLERAYLLLEDGDWSTANQYCDKILDTDSKNARAYLVKLLAEFKLKKETYLSDLAVDLNKYPNYTKALRFADETLGANLTKYYDAVKGNYEYIRKTIDSDQSELDNLIPKHKKIIQKIVFVFAVFVFLVLFFIAGVSDDLIFSGELIGTILGILCLSVAVSLLVIAYRSLVKASRIRPQIDSIKAAINLKSKIISGTPSLDCQTVKMELLNDSDVLNNICCINVRMLYGLLRKGDCIKIKNKNYKVDISVNDVDVNYAVAGGAFAYCLYFRTDEEFDLKKGDIICYNKINKLSEGIDLEDEPNMKEFDYSIVEDLIAAGNKIQAIKVLRETYGLTLSEAKRICDNM